jgi:hypothetical protein
MHVHHTPASCSSHFVSQGKSVKNIHMDTLPVHSDSSLLCKTVYNRVHKFTQRHLKMEDLPGQMKKTNQ